MTSYLSQLKWLVPLIMLLTIIACVGGLWPADGETYAITNFRGEHVTINARGLYYWDTVSSTAQMQANDLVTLVLGVPLLGISLWLSLRGSLRGRLMLAGTLGFVLYTYITMAFGAAYNSFFLIYTALFSLSLFAIVLTLLTFDLSTLPDRFGKRLPRRAIAGLLIFAAAFLTLAWVGRIAATFQPGAIPALENVTSMFIQVMDLGIIVPVCVLAAVLLLRRNAWGYLLASVGMMKFVSMGLAVTLMGLNMARVGVPVSVIELGVFPVITLLNLILTVQLLRSIEETPGEVIQASESVMA